MPKEKLVCNCNKTMPLDAKALGAALKLDSTPRLSSELCGQHLAAFEAAVKSGSNLVVACTQEAPLFTELHEKLKGSGSLGFVNIREAPADVLYPHPLQHQQRADPVAVRRMLGA